MAKKQKHTPAEKAKDVAVMASILDEYDKEDQVWMIRTVIELTDIEEELYVELH